MATVKELADIYTESVILNEKIDHRSVYDIVHDAYTAGYAASEEARLGALLTLLNQICERTEQRN